MLPGKVPGISLVHGDAVRLVRVEKWHRSRRGLVRRAGSFGTEWKSREGMLRFEERRQRILINTEHTTDEPNLVSGWDDSDKPSTDISDDSVRCCISRTVSIFKSIVVMLPAQSGYWIHDLTFDLYRCVDVSIEDGHLTIKLHASKTASGEQTLHPVLLCRLLCDEEFLVTSIAVFHNDAVVIELSQNAATGKIQSR